MGREKTTFNWNKFKTITGKRIIKELISKLGIGNQQIIKSGFKTEENKLYKYLINTKYNSSDKTMESNFLIPIIKYLW